MRTMLALAAALGLAAPGLAAETDVENPGLRELPIQRGGPIMGGKQHQPTPAEINERAQVKGGATAADQQRPTDDLYQRVLKQSQQGTPRTLEPSQ